MAVDPNTGQTVINIPGFDQKYAQFIDPSQIGALTAQQQQLGQQSQLAQALMQRGYVPNSGFGGALSQMVQAALGMKMLNDSRGQMAGLNQKILEQTAAAAKAKHDQDLADKKFETDESIRKDVGIHKGEGDYDLSVGPQKNTLEAQKAGMVAQAQLPTELQKIAAEGKNSANAAYIGATAGQQAKIKEMQDAGATPEQIKAALVGPEAYSIGGGGPTKADQGAIDKRIPELTKGIDLHQNALDLVHQMQQKLAAGAYDNAGKTGVYNQFVSHVPIIGQMAQTSGGQELGADAANLILAAQGALNSTGGGRGSVLQLKTLQAGKPSNDKSPEANMAALNTLEKELQGSQDRAQAELAHYGNGGTPKTWAAASAKSDSPSQSSGKKVVRTGTAPDGSRVAQFDDGSIGPAP